MILLFTDFGLDGPYHGQMKAAIHALAPDVPVIDLVADLAPYEPKAAGYLLPALVESFPDGSVFVCVVDPGVGGPRRPLVQRSRKRWFVGPDNGLLDPETTRDPKAERWEITWRPERALSTSFHGRDQFAPVAAMLAAGRSPAKIGCRKLDEPPPGIPPDWPRIVYLDRFGNAVSGTRAATMSRDAVLSIRGHKVPRAETFSDVGPGQPFWYENSSGLVEIAVNRGFADEDLGLDVGDPFVLHIPRRRKKK